SLTNEKRRDGTAVAGVLFRDVTVSDPAEKIGCEPTEFRCSSGQCVDSGRYCDGNSDCFDSSDEPERCTRKRGEECEKKSFLKLTIPGDWARDKFGRWYRPEEHIWYNTRNKLDHRERGEECEKVPPEADPFRVIGPGIRSLGGGIVRKTHLVQHWEHSSPTLAQKLPVAVSLHLKQRLITDLSLRPHFWQLPPRKTPSPAMDFQNNDLFPKSLK
ncbi:hypothetical protein CEXT_260911, partial [Caerostris extrusa]